MQRWLPGIRIEKRARGDVKQLFGSYRLLEKGTGFLILCLWFCALDTMFRDNMTV